MKIRLLSSNLRLLLLLTFFILDVWAEERRATFIFTADMPVVGDERKGAYARLATLLDEVRAARPETVFLFGGASLGPSTMSGFDRGAHIIDVLNSLEPDAMGVTKREFSYYEDELSLRAYEAGFPMVASNLFDPLIQGTPTGLVDSFLIEKGSLTIGVVSIVHPSVTDEYPLQRVQITSPREEVNAKAQQLRSSGAHIIVLLYSHTSEFVKAQLENGVVDLAFMTDPDLDIRNEGDMWTHPRNISLTQYSQAAIVTCTLHENGKEILTTSWDLLNLADYAPDPEVASQTTGYTMRLNRLLDERIGQLQTTMDTSRKAVRSGENAFANLLTDAIRSFTQTDIALLNGGIIRAEKQYEVGTFITRGDIFEELPFRNKVATLTISGKAVIQALENGLSLLESLEGRFPHVSGMQVTYDSTLPAGQRVLTVEVDGKPLDPNANYTLATTQYLANGGDGYRMFTESASESLSNKSPPLLSDIVISRIRKQNQISPVVKNRMTDISSGNPSE
ncbi:bifunctional metallophosphatase/5'-nucleotidase [Alteromonas sp. ASW11-130]|uniref:bifunctional metallophosphatase/5'-nucleotidase n=1 Tax=Alteromonas sp. ASW11-130 TaxID=3015775 RepID=UPI002241F7D8|nr:5'-nucleotidase C-terminal domain-containing protein [Alteromonas sp. ASW11-130]MCW8093203.1 5'-nucleotidase C-terminal domain-containing protein [Alteromonas sp. ASW11-130]